MIIFYNFFIQLLWFITKGSGLFNYKARLWILGRKNWKQQLKNNIPNDRKIIWFHCASLGEFEQGRPIIECFKRSHSEYFVLLTFFSPSGFEIRKNYAYADYITYLPLDTSSNAEYFISSVNPSWVIFVKYEFWYHFLHALHKVQIPTLLVAAVFRPNQIFFKWYGSFFKRIPFFFQRIFVQNQESKDLLKQIGYTNTTVVGDTRIDRVIDIASGVQTEQRIIDFIGNRKVLIAGSTWPPEEKILVHWMNEVNLEEWCLILAPHQVVPNHIKKITEQFKDHKLSLYSKGFGPNHSDILVIDTIGMLSGLYQVGTMALIGGGFGKSIHNILEPAAFGIPIIIGPQHSKFIEAQTLIAKHGAFVVEDGPSFMSTFLNLCQEPIYQAAKKTVRNFIQANKGATDQLIQYINNHI